jgi:AraC family transcriptional regulator, transcriptional activator of pobA
MRKSWIGLSKDGEFCYTKDMKAQQGYQEKYFTGSSVARNWNLFRNTLDEPVRPHWHDYLEILYLAEGACEMQLERQTIRLAPGDLTVISAGSSHAFPRTAGCVFLVIQIKTEFLFGGSFRGEWQYLIPFIQVGNGHNALCRLSANDEILAILHDLEQDDREKLPGYELNMKGKLLCLFAQLIRLGIISYPHEQQLRLLRKMEPALAYVDTHAGEPLSVSQAARMCFMSSHYFSRCFHQATGRTFSDYVRHVRLFRVRELLATTDLAVQIIAVQAGFATASHLAAAFRKSYGLSPAAWRRSNREPDMI